MTTSEKRIAQFVVEEGGNERQYHKVHVAGCRDLKDPNPVGEASDWDGLLEATQRVYGEEFDSLPYLKSLCPPCVRSALK